MRYPLIAAMMAALLCSATVQAKDPLPPNVTTTPYGGGSNQAIDTIDYSFPINKAVPFPRVKMCMAENVTNDEVQLHDSAGSFVGHRGTYYQTHNSSIVQGGDIFKYVDDASKSLIAHGSTNRQGGLGGMIGLAIRFDLEVTVEDANVRMKMRHIESAMKNTGSTSNNGFNPIGVWPGSMYKKNLQALDGVAAQVRSCILG